MKTIVKEMNKENGGLQYLKQIFSNSGELKSKKE